MLLIRKAQMDALRGDAVERFVLAAVRDARKRLPRRCGERTEAQLISLFEAALPKAEAFGLEEPPEVLPFLDLILAHGLDFELSEDLEWSRALLQSRELGASAKILLVYGRLTASQHP